jgi:hypothetical protein
MSDFFTPNSTARNSTLINKEGEFPSPFLDVANFMLPGSLKEVLDLCTMFWLKHGTYRSAAERIVRYFITDVDFEQGEDDRVDLTSFLNTDLNINAHASHIGDDLLSCGITVSSVIFPFNRYLRCPACHREYFIDNIAWDFKNGGDFVAKCGNSNCAYGGKFEVVDRKSFDKKRVHIHRWNPYNIDIQKHPYSGRILIHWDIPSDIRNKVKGNDKFIIRDMPLEMLKTIHDNAVFQFSPHFVHYEAEENIATVDLGGWGLPRLISNFSQAYYTQVIKKANESLAKDYMVPFRLLSPAGLPQDQNTPWMGSVNSELVNQAVSDMVERHRSNPTSWNFSPVPMQYQALSGEGNQMATPDLLRQGINELLTASGIPVDFYEGTLSLQAAPMALKALEQSWPGMSKSLNRWLDFVVTSTTKYMNWETPKAIKYKKVSWAHDMERRHLVLQLASANMVSKRTAYESWGIDPKEEQEKIMDEMQSEMESQTEFQEEMANREETQAMLAQGGGMPGGMVGDPSAAAGMSGGPAAQSPYDINTVSGRAQQVDELAQQLVSMPYGPRRTEMSNIKNSDPELHALVKAKMEEIRSDVSSQAKQSLVQGG